MSSMTLSLSADEDDDTIAADARALADLISRETEIDATVIEGNAREGERGGAVELGQIALAFLTGGTAVALLDVLRPWFDRRRRGKIEIELPNLKLSVESDDLHDERYTDLVRQIETALEKAVT